MQTFIANLSCVISLDGVVLDGDVFNLLLE